jgi:hypothetical protein
MFAILFAMKRLQSLRASAAALVMALSLTACAYNPVQPGMTREAVIARMGTPSRVVPLPAGTRLQYSLQPAGRQAIMVDLDASDHVVQARQVLVAQEFARIEVGKWTRDDVERAFGRPASVDHVANWPSDILTYRWYETQDMFYWVYLDRNNVVRRTEQGVEYHHDD